MPDTLLREPDVAAVLVTGEGERGICAGGDIRVLYESGGAGTSLAESFWRKEYRVNARISRLAKPYIAVMDGISMGGGGGISTHGSHRIVPQRTRLAMPETGTGVFPDVGGSWLLSRDADHFGTFLALTGEQIGAADAIDAGLADFYLPAASLPQLFEALSALSGGSRDDRITLTIASFAQRAQPSPLSHRRPQIADMFGHVAMERIFAALEEDGSAFAGQILATLSTKSLVSLKVTLQLLQQARSSPDLETCLDREFAATPAVLASHDFYEGVRAAIIDKDRHPRWQPADLALAGADLLAPYLAAHPRPLFASDDRLRTRP